MKFEKQKLSLGKQEEVVEKVVGFKDSIQNK